MIVNFFTIISFVYISAINAENKSLAQNDELCGVKGPDKVPRIVGGVNANPLEFPWQISLRTVSQGYWYHTCGGSLIKDQWVLTAGHCVDGRENPRLFVVRVGEHDTRIKEGTEVDMNVSKVIKHELYDPQTIDNDVALLKLSKPLDLNGKHKYLGLICLPNKGDDVRAGTNCIATGWGNTAWEGTQPDILQKVTIPMVDQKQCERAYSDVNEVTRGMICAGRGGKGTCQGDSGGPLQCKIANKWVQYGATSWGVHCSDPEYPGVYARVAEYSDWIWNKISYN